MSTASRGNAAELATAAFLATLGYACGSRRHMGGAGDLLAVHENGDESLVLEVKRTRRKWEGFGPKDRQLMREFAARHKGMTAVYAWWPTKSKLELIYEHEWPDP